MMLVALIPARNEESTIGAAIDGLHKQSCPPDRIISVCDNCTDNTEIVAKACQVEVIKTIDNLHKKAGALNQVLNGLLPTLEDEDFLLVQDADSVLDKDFIKSALSYLKTGHYGAVGGIFRGDEGGGFVGHLQRNEFTRYARDISRLAGKCEVVSGTGSIYSVKTLRHVQRERINGYLPVGDGKGGIYDTEVLTEDNELTQAILHLGYRTISPDECTLVTEVMPTWHDLLTQRVRWMRGSMEGCVQYGFTRVNRILWIKHAFRLVGALVTIMYPFAFAYCIFTGELTFNIFWLALGSIAVAERVITVRGRGYKQALLAATMYELIYDLFLQFAHVKALIDATMHKKHQWNLSDNPSDPKRRNKNVH